jgi:hypothetical protein
MPLYDVEVPGLEPWDGAEPDDVWIEVELPANERAGALTLAGHLSAHATIERPSPVRRGVFVLQRLLCVDPPPPPAGVDTSVVEQGGGGEQANVTNRERYAAHAQVEACAGCHAGIDPIGFSFERWDAAGGYQLDEAWPGQDWDTPEWLTVDAAGELGGALVPEPLHGLAFEDAVELMHLLADRREVQRCYVRQRYAYALGRNLAHGSADAPAIDEQVVDVLTDQFVEADAELDALVLAIVTSEAFLHRTEVGE